MKMTTTLPPFIQGQTKEGVEWELINNRTGLPIPITSGVITEITARFFTPDFGTLQFEGTYTGGKVILIDSGTNGECKFQPAAGDMDTVGKYRGELHVQFSDNSDLKVHDLIIKIEEKSPTS